jgi:DNA ligase-1
VGSTRSRKLKASALADLLRRARPQEIRPAVAFLSGRMRQGRIGLGPAAVRDARPGETASDPVLELSEVDREFETIAGISGAGSTGERTRRFAALLARATDDEQAFLARLVLGELRQGALEGIMAEALAEATGLPESDVRRALMLAGELEDAAHAALTEGAAGLGRFRLELFRPLRPMLAQPADDLDGVLERLGLAAIEYKLDGARIQVHKVGDEVRVWSRRLNEVTDAVPELVERVRALPARQLLLDGEVLAMDADERPLPFQVTMRRFGRRRDLERLRSEVPLTPFFFDVLHLDGEDLLDRPARDRFDALAEAVGDRMVPRRITADPEEARRMLAEALRLGHEGVMAKSLEREYQAGSRGYAWLKVKPVHTLDLVVLAAEWGSGRRRGWLSNLHLGARDPTGGGFVMLGKTFKGMTDKMLAWQTARLQQLEVTRDSHVVHVRPELVVEVAFGDVQHSPQYPAGLALRFARVKRYRQDKTADAADTLDAVRALLPPDRHGTNPT